jgi:ferrochelatase
MSEKPIVLLLNMGGPSALTEVETFLLNLFNDPDILDMPGGWLLRPWLARRIVKKRGPHARAIYAQIGGKSPILDITRALAGTLEEALAGRVRVRIAMRYTQPDTAAALKDVTSRDRVLVLPLYPQYSKTTTGSSFNEIRRVAQRCNLQHNQFNWVNDYHDHAAYISAWVSAINKSLVQVPKTFAAQEVPILFSAHGVPCKVIAGGDPYEAQTKQSVSRICELGGWPRPHSLAYQSKVGRAKWLGPHTQEMIASLASQGARGLLVVPISFVCEHSETLYEQDILLKQVARDAGIEYYWRVPAFNTAPEFISCLRQIIAERL